MVKKHSLNGWARKGWTMKMCRYQAQVPSLFPTDKVHYNGGYVPSVKVKIIIEEIK